MTDDKAQEHAPHEYGTMGKPSQAEGDDSSSEVHEVLDVPGKPSQAEGGDEGGL
jgi:hypothetical protein